MNMLKKSALSAVCLAGLGTSSLLAAGLSDYEYAYTLDSGTKAVSVTTDGSYVGFSNQVGTTRIDMTKATQVAVTGTITNWTGKANSAAAWDGLWSSIGMIGTNYWTNRDTSSNNYAFLGNSDLGDTAHQCGLGASGLIPYEIADGTFSVKLEDKPASGGGDTALGSNPSTIYFAVVYDTANNLMTGHASLDNSNWTTITLPLAANGTQYNDWSDCVFSVVAANNSSADTIAGNSSYGTMGFNVDWKVTSTVVPEPASMSLLLLGALGLVRRCRK